MFVIFCKRRRRRDERQDNCMSTSSSHVPKHRHVHVDKYCHIVIPFNLLYHGKIAIVVHCMLILNVVVSESC